MVVLLFRVSTHAACALDMPTARTVTVQSTSASSTYVPMFDMRNSMRKSSRPLSAIADSLPQYARTTVTVTPPKAADKPVNASSWCHISRYQPTYPLQPLDRCQPCQCRQSLDQLARWVFTPLQNDPHNDFDTDSFLFVALLLVPRREGSFVE
jgi:hypothetical protein